MPEIVRSRAFLLKLLAAFACIYFIWGSTFLAIRIAIEHLPPLLMCGVRLLLAGVMLLVWSGLRRLPWPRGAEWWNAAAVGLLLPGIGNACVTLGTTHVASGLIALLAATIPLWMALLGAFGPQATPLSPRTIAGLGFGLAGIALLVGPRTGLHAAGSTNGVAFVWSFLPLFGAFTWAWGSLWSRRIAMPRSPLVSTAIGMTAGGLAVLGLGAGFGEGARLDLAAVPPMGWACLLYLSVFGSVIAFTAYLWLLKVTTPTRVSTYAFVNPVVAMALGWAFAGEAVTARTLAAGAMVLTAVALIVTAPVTRSVPASGATVARPARAGAAGD